MCVDNFKAEMFCSLLEEMRSEGRLRTRSDGGSGDRPRELAERLADVAADLRKRPKCPRPRPRGDASVHRGEFHLFFRVAFFILQFMVTRQCSWTALPSLVRGGKRFKYVVRVLSSPVQISNSTT